MNKYNSELSVVIATQNRWDNLQNCLIHLESIPERPEIIVVDNNSHDGTSELCIKHFSNVKLIKLKKNIGTGARNIGVKQSRKPYVAFSDDDSLWEPGSLARAIEIFKQHDKVGLIAARILIGNERRLDPACTLMQKSPIIGNESLPGVPIIGFICCGAIVRKDPFLKCGGFEKKYLIGGEETLFSVKLRQNGYDIIYCDEIICRHLPSPIVRRYRQVLMARNNLWTTWLKRPLPAVFEITLFAIQKLNDPIIREGFFRAILGIPWVLKNRDVVTPEIEKELRITGAGYQLY